MDGFDDNEASWSRRYKANQEKLASGDLTQVTQVVIDLDAASVSAGSPPGRSGS